jgi:hypothetical protein
MDRLAPAAAPGNAAMVGLRIARNAPVSVRCRSCRSITRSSNVIDAFVSLLPMPFTLPPAQNAFPAPVKTIAPIPLSSPHSLIILRRAGVRLSDRELRASGRFSVIVATRSRTVHKTSSVPVSIAIALIGAHPLLEFGDHLVAASPVLS